MSGHSLKGKPIAQGGGNGGEQRSELTDACQFRHDVRTSDCSIVREILLSAGFFYDHEIDVAIELVNEGLAQGAANGYLFVFAGIDGQTVGYSCFGEIPCTVGSYDLYWIAVHKNHRGRGLGRAILSRTESRMASLGGRRVYAETSSRDLYAPTRAFYDNCGYQAEARLKDFYSPGDDKIVYVKSIESP